MTQQFASKLGKFLALFVLGASALSAHAQAFVSVHIGVRPPPMRVERALNRLVAGTQKSLTGSQSTRRNSSNTLIYLSQPVIAKRMASPGNTKDNHSEIMHLICGD